VPYLILKGRWCHIIVLNAHAPTENKTDDVKDNLYEELERVFDKFPKYYVNIFQDAKVGREDIFKSTTGSANLHEINNYNRIRIANLVYIHSNR
jgi:hypothetical protein